jgi:hypothetical protein
MKKYYIFNGTVQLGPFDLEDLKSQTITKDTPIWFEGLADWTIAGKVEEISSLFDVPKPPPFRGNETVLPFKSEPNQQVLPSKPKTIKKGVSVGSVFLWTGLALGVIILFLVIRENFYVIHNSGDEYIETVEEEVLTQEDRERLEPAKFLHADGKYRETILGNKIRIFGVVTSSATVVSYKDAVVKVTYYSKTKTELGSEKYVVYESFSPGSMVEFELKVDNYSDVETIGWEVVDASLN